MLTAGTLRFSLPKHSVLELEMGLSTPISSEKARAGGASPTLDLRTTLLLLISHVSLRRQYDCSYQLSPLTHFLRRPALQHRSPVR